MANITKIENSNVDEKAVAEAAIGSDAAIMDEQPEDIYVHTFSKPVLYDGKEYETLTFEFGKLTGHDNFAVMDELTRKGINVLMKSVNDHYIARMCARACKEQVGYDIFDIMPIKDCNTIINRSRRFF